MQDVMGWKRCAQSERHTRTQASYLNIVVDASGYNLIAGVIESYSQNLVRVLKCLNSSFFPDIPQLKKHGSCKSCIEIFSDKITGSCRYLAETQHALLKSPLLDLRRSL